MKKIVLSTLSLLFFVPLASAQDSVPYEWRTACRFHPYGVKLALPSEGDSMAFACMADPVGNQNDMYGGQYWDFNESIIIKDGEAVRKGGNPGNTYGWGAFPTFSPDGTSFSFSVREDGMWFVVKDGVKLKPYKYVSGVTYSPDGKHFAYPAKNYPVPGRDGMFIVKDNEELKDYPSSSYPVWSPDGKHFAYLAKESGKTGKEFVVMDGVPGKKYDEIVSTPGNVMIVFSPDSESFAYVAKEGGKIFVVKDGEEGPKYDEALGFEHRPVQSLKYSQTSRSFAYIRKDRVVRNGADVPGCEVSDTMAFTFEFIPNSEKIICRNRGVITLEGEKIADYKYVPNLAISNDGKHLAYYVDDNTAQYGLDSAVGRKFIVLDGKEISGFDYAGKLTFSPDSKKFAYVSEKNGKSVLVENGIEKWPEYTSILHIQYSADSKKLFMMAKKRKDEKAWRTVEVDADPSDYLSSDYLGMTNDVPKPSGILTKKQSEYVLAKIRPMSERELQNIADRIAGILEGRKVSIKNRALLGGVKTEIQKELEKRK